MENPKIIKRHLNSYVLSLFFRRNVNYFGTVHDFLLDSSQQKSGPKLLNEFINEMIEVIEEGIKKIVPNYETIIRDPELKEWYRDLMWDDDSLIKKVSMQYYTDIKELEKIKQEEFKKGAPVDKITRVFNRIQKENLISFLSTANVIPKYGFPVDVVEMHIPRSENNDVRLNRDLSIAIGEYAPGSQIVANGNIYESTGVRKVKGFELPTLFYYECNECKNYEVIERLNPNYNKFTHQCSQCGQETPVYKMIIPKFGFTAR
ncbi:hypothetical protein RhiirA1_405388, partial [Rhizophagus irregularis]